MCLLSAHLEAEPEGRPGGRSTTPGGTATGNPHKWTEYGSEYPHEWQHRGLTPSRLLKAQLCKFFYGEGPPCLRFNTCTFAHHVNDLSPPPVGLDVAASDYPKQFTNATTTTFTPAFKAAFAKDSAGPRPVDPILRQMVEAAKAPPPPKAGEPSPKELYHYKPRHAARHAAQGSDAARRKT